VTSEPNLGGWHDFYLTNTTPYRYYRVNITASAASANAAFEEWQLYSEGSTSGGVAMRLSQGTLQLGSLAGTGGTRLLGLNADGTVTALTSTPSGVGDNLGNHMATETVLGSSGDGDKFALRSDLGTAGARISASGSGMVLNVGMPSTTTGLAVGDLTVRLVAGSGSNAYEGLRLTGATGRLGIGTSAPSAKLDIQGGADGLGTSDPGALAFSWRNGGYRHFVRSRHNSTVTSVGNDLDFYLNNSTSSGGSSAAGTGNIQVMTLESYNSTPRVGIGTTSPAATLHVTGTSGTSNVRLESLAGTGTRVVTADASGNLGSSPLPTDAQQLSLSGQTLSLTNGGSVTLPSYTSEATTASNGLTLSGTDVKLGGALSATTTIDQANNMLSFTGGKIGLGTSTDISGSRINIVAGSAAENVLFAKLYDNTSTANSLKLEHVGSNLIVRPATAGGSISVVENSAGALALNPNGGNIGIGTGTTAPNSGLTVNATTAYVPTLSIAGGSSGSPTLLASTNSTYLGLSPADATNNNYRLPAPSACPGRMYIIRNNSGANTALLSTAGGSLYNGNGSSNFSTYSLPVNADGKTVIVFSDGINWTIAKLN